jgi:hypothetical protein
MTEKYGFPWEDVESQLKMRRMMFEAHSQNFYKDIATRLKPIDIRHDAIIKAWKQKNGIEEK